MTEMNELARGLKLLRRYVEKPKRGFLKLSPSKRKEVVEQLFLSPRPSVAEICETCGVSNSTVRKIWSEESSGRKINPRSRRVPSFRCGVCGVNSDRKYEIDDNLCMMCISKMLEK